MEQGNAKLASRLRDMAETLGKEIAHRRAPRLENTIKRAREAAGQREEARRLEKIQAALVGLAGAHERNQVPLPLVEVTTKKQIEHLVAGYKLTAWEQSQRDWLVELSDQQAGQLTADDQIKELERQLVGRKIDGFFPTPLPIVRSMLQYADIMPGDKVLEPSAGKGNIADLVRELHPSVQLDVMEVNHTLRGILAHKEHIIIGLDCLTGHNPTYDIVVMNPPFEKLADIDHVRYCFEHYVKPGGRLVSIMGESAFFRSDKKAMEFREWLAEVETAEMSIPAGAFQESGTGVKTRMIVVDKPIPSNTSEDQPQGEEETYTNAPVEMQTPEFAASFEGAMEEAYQLAEEPAELADTAEPEAEELTDDEIAALVAAQVGGFAAAFGAAMEQAYQLAQASEEAEDTPHTPSQDAPQGDMDDILTEHPLTNERRSQKALDGFGTHDKLIKLRQTRFF